MDGVLRVTKIGVRGYIMACDFKLFIPVKVLSDAKWYRIPTFPHFFGHSGFAAEPFSVSEMKIMVISIKNKFDLERHPLEN